MKKSMLFSTIAMIVVVIMAISTATFAWFSSFQTVSASLDFSIESADSGLEMRANTGRATGAAATVGAWGAWGQSVEMISPSGNDGKFTLSSPTDAIASPTLGANVDAVPTNDKAVFFAAINNDTEVTISGVEGANGVADVGYAAYSELQVRYTGKEAANYITCTATVVPQGALNADGSIKETYDMTPAETEALKATKILIVGSRGGYNSVAAAPFIMGEQYYAGFYNAQAFAAAKDAAMPSGAIKTEAANTDVVFEASASRKLLDVGGRLQTTTGLVSENSNVNGFKKVMTKNWGDTEADRLLGDSKNIGDRLTLRIYVWIDGHKYGNDVRGAQMHVSVVFSQSAIAPPEPTPGP